MNPPSPKHPFTLQTLVIAAGLLASLCLGACSRSSHITDSLAGPTHEAGLGVLAGSTLSDPGDGATDVPFDPSSEENVGLAAGGIGKGRPQPPATPTLSTPTDGAIDVALNPTLAWNASVGAKSYRLQVSTSAAFSATIIDQAGISATSTAISGLLAGTQHFWRVSARNAGGSSAFSAPFSFSTAAGAPPPPPPPPPAGNDPCVSLVGFGGPVVPVAADVVQFRVGRLRIEVVGDVAAGTINAMGPCTASDVAADHFISGTGSVTLSGSGTPVTTTGGSLTFGPLLFLGAGVEPGIVIASDANGNVLEIIWPGLAGLPPGPPILRLQLSSYSAAVQAGVSLDATMTFTARAPDGSTATFTVAGTNMVVPPLQ